MKLIKNDGCITITYNSRIPVIETFAFVQSCYDYQDQDDLSPQAEHKSVGYTVFEWCLEQRCWIEGEEFYEDRDKAIAEAQRLDNEARLLLRASAYGRKYEYVTSYDAGPVDPDEPVDGPDDADEWAFDLIKEHVASITEDDELLKEVIEA